MSINSMDELYKQATDKFLSEFVKYQSRYDVWEDFEGCLNRDDVWNLITKTGELEVAYDKWANIIYNIVVENCEHVWKLIWSSKLPDYLIESVADKYGLHYEYKLDDILKHGDSDLFAYRIIEEFYMSVAYGGGPRWWYRFQDDYLDTVMEILEKLGIM